MLKNYTLKYKFSILNIAIHNLSFELNQLVTKLSNDIYMDLNLHWWVIVTIPMVQIRP